LGLAAVVICFVFKNSDQRLRQCSGAYAPGFHRQGASCGILFTRIQHRRGQPAGVDGVWRMSRERAGSFIIVSPAIARCAPMSAFTSDRSFPFTDLPEKDSDSSERAGVLDATTAFDSVPRFHTNTSYEYWGRAASLIHTSADGRSDMKIPDSTRIIFGGLQTFSGAFPPVKSNPRSGNTAQQLQNPNPIRWFWRAFILIWMNGARWQDAAGQYLSKVSEERCLVFRKLISPRSRSEPLQDDTAYHLDFGATWTRESQRNRRWWERLHGTVPKSDADGNDLGGVRLPELQVPLAT